MDETARSAPAAHWDRICFHYGLVGWKTGGRSSLEYRSEGTLQKRMRLEIQTEGLQEEIPADGLRVRQTLENQQFVFLMWILQERGSRCMAIHRRQGATENMKFLYLLSREATRENKNNYLVFLF